MKEEKMNQDVNTQENMFNSLLDNYIAQAKYAGMTKEEKVMFKEKLIENFNARVSAVVTINMPDEHKEEFLQVLERDNEEETGEFIKKHIPNIEQIIGNEASAFVSDLIVEEE
jgi:hypothetical protein